ncbi:DnaJ domain-containing protein [Zoogloea sp. LCSB751]|uniref:J domain-containing protein n=1 Tax=Zoogloea sp. LCSB751 TaxID=1965277 RepID=UPI0009A4E473|nr:DnaJ domain-containing protein [Zoogloea sp. LCSB751]
MTARTTLYDLLGLAPTASEADIQAAHLRLTRHYQSGNHGLPPADVDNKLKAIREAVWILADPGRRAAYDAGLARSRPAVAEAVVEPLLVRDPLPLQVEIKAAKRSPLRIMLGVIGTLMIIGMLIQIFFSVFAFRRVASGDGAAEAQQKVIAAERRQMYGDMSEQEIAEQEAAERRQRAESVRRQEEQRAEYARKEEERQREHALQERSYYADRVSAELQQAEEAARRKAEYEQRQKEEQQRRAEAEEQNRLQERLARERARLHLNN